MAQTAKFIDVTRTFLPVDPNSFPETLHVGQREDAPEQRIPVMAYKGYNFLPTSYGYKSYFGTNQDLGISALPARVDAIFIYQNEEYENILIALTETGIWTKTGSTAGDWVNSVPIALQSADMSVHFEWTYTVIADVLYAYMQGQPSYQKIISSTATGITITSVVPNFLNMVAQVGIFKANGRLAFWDSTDSVGWANIDDFADFEPSLETLAGNVSFSDVQGRIVTILPHGGGFMIYATKSIVYIAQTESGVFQWNPTIVLPNAGIAYPRQVTFASPDTIHFAYTNEGLKRIENAKEATIVPEVTDFFRPDKGPIYLRVLQGRYLCLELLDGDYIAGRIQLTTEDIPPDDYFFPGASYDIPTVEVPGLDSAVCPIFAGIDAGTYPSTYPSPLPNDQHATNKMMKPIWTCHISRHGIVDPANIVWGPTPCVTMLPGKLVDSDMCPEGITVDSMTTDDTNKIAVTGEAAYIDGWTMERFVQVQTAIWEAEKRAINAVVTAITTKSDAGFASAVGNVCSAEPPTKSACFLGRYVTEFSDPKFGWSKCAFWLTRYAIGAMDLYRDLTHAVACADNPDKEEFTLWAICTTNCDPFTQASAASAVADFSVRTEQPMGLGTVTSVSPYGAPLSYSILDLRVTDGTLLTQRVQRYVTATNLYIINTTGSARNRGDDVDIVPTPETAYCEIVGWEYTKADGTTGIAGAAACDAPSLNPAGGPKNLTAIDSPNKANVAMDDGSLCGKEYPPITIAGYEVLWPDGVVTIPAGSFLLQRGSIAPVYPTFEGSLVYDMQLKKWGKMKLRYKQLLDYAPVNSTSEGIVPTSTFGILSGALRSNGKIAIFDAYPAQSFISYGKIGYNRLGNTSTEEVRVDFRAPSTGYMTVETSLRGTSLSNGLTKTVAFADAMSATLQGAWPGRWCNVEIGGIFDITYLEYRGFTQGRR